jgi:integrase
MNQAQQAETAALAKAEAAERLFGNLADVWLRAREANNSKKTYARDERSVNYPKHGYRGAKGFGGFDASEVKSSHLSALAEQFNKPTRVRVISAARKIMAVAKRKGFIAHSPFSDINFNDGLPKHKEKERPAITDEKQFGDLLRKIESYEGRSNNLTSYALRLLALTFVRPDTMAKAEWKHFDLKGARWVIPFEALKMEWLRSETGQTHDDFVVPLSRQAMALLHELHEITANSRYLFPGCGDAAVMSDSTPNNALRGLGYKGVHCAHGFRASASTILNRQRTKDGRRRFETALVEIQQDRLDASTRAIYDRDDLMPERIELMQFWADKIDALRDGGLVVAEGKKKKLQAVG